MYLELCEAFCQLSRLTEAKELMQEAAAKFQGTSQEMRCGILYITIVCTNRVYCDQHVCLPLCVWVCLQCVCVTE